MQGDERVEVGRLGCTAYNVSQLSLPLFPEADKQKGGLSPYDAMTTE